MNAPHALARHEIHLPHIDKESAVLLGLGMLSAGLGGAGLVEDIEHAQVDRHRPFSKKEAVAGALGLLGGVALIALSVDAHDRHTNPVELVHQTQKDMPNGFNGNI